MTVYLFEKKSFARTRIGERRLMSFAAKAFRCWKVSLPFPPSFLAAAYFHFAR